MIFKMRISWFVYSMNIKWKTERKSCSTLNQQCSLNFRIDFSNKTVEGYWPKLIAWNVVLNSTRQKKIFILHCMAVITAYVSRWRVLFNRRNAKCWITSMIHVKQAMQFLWFNHWNVRSISWIRHLNFLDGHRSSIRKSIFVHSIRL